jgi:hypothetical protein
MSHSVDYGAWWNYSFSRLGGRVHPQIAFAKLQALSGGAALASKRLWKRADVLV